MGDKPHVLVVDDSADFLDIICPFLEHLGLQASPLQSADHNEILDACSRMRPHALLLDVYLSAEPIGLSVAEALRDGPLGQDLKILFWTSVRYDSLASSAVGALAATFPEESFIDKTEDLGVIARRLDAIFHETNFTSV